MNRPALICEVDWGGRCTVASSPQPVKKKTKNCDSLKKQSQAALSMPLLFCLWITSLRLNPNLLFTTAKSKQASKHWCSGVYCVVSNWAGKNWISSAFLSLDGSENI